jgi:hypothetical protein
MSEIQYIPGSCNIGKKEIQRRQFVGVAGLFLSISTFVTLNSMDASIISSLAIFFPLMMTFTGLVQSRSKFCLAYGFAGTFNIGKLGEISKVASPEDRAADRKTALLILGKSFLLAAIATGAVLVLLF